MGTLKPCEEQEKVRVTNIMLQLSGWHTCDYSVSMNKRDAEFQKQYLKAKAAEIYKQQSQPEEHVEVTKEDMDSFLEFFPLDEEE